ncbi:MAG: glutathione S-transferase N-terminal domain-containing protein [Clostridia bacterium]|nr:glutathione S-transferase N-terminal domain-containing protein [Deltaproteobacteria bacterium]
MNNEALRQLSLYHYEACPYCQRVRHELKRMNREVELRDIHRDRGRREELLEGGGMTQVPCLRIEKDGGKVEWMYESMDIIAYLRQNST